MKCKNCTKDIDLRVSSTKNGKAMMQYVVVKNQETLGDPLQKTKKEFKNLKKQEIQTISIK